MLDFLANPDIWLSFATLTVLEIVLGIDNVIFIAILTSKLPVEQRQRAQLTGLSVALVTRILLLLSAFWIMTLDEDLFFIGNFGFSGHEMILIAGGIFLVYKAVTEIHQKLEGEEGSANAPKGNRAFAAVIWQILVLDIVFSLDGVITAVGMTNNIGVMIAAVVISSIVMIFSVRTVGGFVDRHPTVKMLALSFLVLIGSALIAEGFGAHLDKAFIYGPMAFAVAVEALNIVAAKRAQKRKAGEAKPVHLHESITKG